MNTKVKIGIAAAIVVALVAILIIEQATGSSEPKGKSSPAAATDTPLFASKKDPDRPRNESGEIILGLGVPDPSPKKEEVSKAAGEVPTQPQASKPEPGVEDYVVKQGDTLVGIAEQKYGDSTLWKAILDQNAGLKPQALRVGQKIQLPIKPALKTLEPKVESDAGGRSYVVQVGDTLGKISQKVYSSARYADRIFEANRDKLTSPDQLEEGMKLLLPEILPPQRPTTPVEEALAGQKLHKVQPKEALWTIAEQYRGDRGVLEMIDQIVRANPAKLRDANTPLRVGWNLSIPEP